MRILIITGNGLSLSLLNKHPVNGVDLSNLFVKGCNVSWPADESPGFLSFEHCPNLWALGAKPHVDRNTGYSVIEKIITAVNACCLADPTTLNKGIYLNAYKELVAYLRYLFVHYDDLMIAADFYKKSADSDIIQWFNNNANNTNVEAIDCVTFNYDVIFERCMQEIGVPFDIPKLEDTGHKIRLYKPHGSISFCSKAVADRSAFSIKYDTQFVEGGLEDIAVRYDNLGENYPVVGILPPAGESERYRHRWIKQIWDAASEAVQRIDSGDLVIIYGLSYWHVDRKEIDNLLARVSRGARVVMINPHPSDHLDAVCCSLFQNYQSYEDASHLERISI
jgi:hypothetical protein